MHVIKRDVLRIYFTKNARTFLRSMLLVQQIYIELYFPVWRRLNWQLISIPGEYAASIQLSFVGTESNFDFIDDIKLSVTIQIRSAFSWLR